MEAKRYYRLEAIRPNICLVAQARRGVLDLFGDK
jgi:hypothetical protein